MSSSSSCLFYYDIVCPFAYIASNLISNLEKQTNKKIIWEPVALGGLYKGTNAPQGTNSATSILNTTKLAVTSRDFLIQINRANITLNYPPASLRTPQQKQPTLKVMRILLAIPQSIRPIYSHAFYKARWVDNLDLTDDNNIRNIVSSINNPSWDSLQLGSITDIYNNNNIKQKLLDNTNLAVSRGVFGVPSFWVNNKLFWGGDRIHFVARELGYKNASPLRLTKNYPTLKTSKGPNVKFYFDFSSPWSYIGSTQIEQSIQKTNSNATIEYIPILLGALFKEIGTPNLPATTLSPAKLEYSRKDFDDWVQYYNIDFKFSPHFPIRTILPLRIILAAKRICYERYVELIHILYRATWVEEQNIAEKSVITSILNKNNYPIDKLLEYTTLQEIKQELIQNTKLAIDVGCCGVPSFQVDNLPIIWGQDRLNILEDILCGWKTPIISPKASL